MFYALGTKIIRYIYDFYLDKGRKEKNSMGRRLFGIPTQILDSFSLVVVMARAWHRKWAMAGGNQIG